MYPSPYCWCEIHVQRVYRFPLGQRLRHDMLREEKETAFHELRLRVLSQTHRIFITDIGPAEAESVA